MSLFTDEELAMLHRLPISELVNLSSELDLVAPEVINRATLAEACVVALVGRGQDAGLPLSKYDHDDLAALPHEHLQAIARLQGISGKATVAAVIRAGERVFAAVTKNHPDSAVAMMVPMLLPAIARVAAGQPR